MTRVSLLKGASLRVRANTNTNGAAVVFCARRVLVLIRVCGRIILTYFTC